jgi:hypothetical protein
MITIRTRLLVFCKQALCLLPPVLAAEFAILWAGAPYGTDAPVAQLLYRSVFRISDALQSSPAGGTGQIAEYRYYKLLGFMGGIAQLILPIVGICLAVLLAGMIRTILPERISGAILQPWIGCTGVLTLLIFQWRSSLVPPISTSMLAFEPAWLEAGRTAKVFYFCVLFASATAMIYVSFLSKQMTFLAAAVFSIFWILHFGLWFVPWFTVPYAFYFHLVSLLAAILGLVWLFRVGQIQEDETQ